MAGPAHITPRDLANSAMLFAVLHDKPTFTTREFAEFTDIAALHLCEELANEILLEVVAAGFLREVGPGVYALIKSGEKAAPMEQQLWQEDARS